MQSIDQMMMETQCDYLGQKNNNTAGIFLIRLDSGASYRTVHLIINTKFKIMTSSLWGQTAYSITSTIKMLKLVSGPSWPALITRIRKAHAIAQLIKLTRLVKVKIIYHLSPQGHKKQVKSIQMLANRMIFLLSVLKSIQNQKMLLSR